jgi:hypothetical protein
MAPSDTRSVNTPDSALENSARDVVDDYIRVQC